MLQYLTSVISRDAFPVICGTSSRYPLDGQSLMAPTVYQQFSVCHTWNTQRERDNTHTERETLKEVIVTSGAPPSGHRDLSGALLSIDDLWHCYIYWRKYVPFEAGNTLGSVTGEFYQHVFTGRSCCKRTVHASLGVLEGDLLTVSTNVVLLRALVILSTGENMAAIEAGNTLGIQSVCLYRKSFTMFSPL